MNNVIRFYEPDQSYGFLSNFAEYPIIVDGVEWHTSEHFYQASKFMARDITSQIYHAATPTEAFQLSREYDRQVRSDWEQIKDNVMLRALRCKFSQHNQLAYWLVATGNNILAEHSFKDSYWGDGGDGSGLNRLGELLMLVREELAGQHPHQLVRYVESAQLPMDMGTFTMHGFVEKKTGKEHVALSYGEIDTKKPVLIRLHSECLTGDALFSLRCDCGFQLNKALKNIVEHGNGVLLYLRQEGRGIGLLNKIRAYHLQDEGADTVEANEKLGFAADMRRYDFCKGILHYFGINEVKLMTNNPRKVNSLTKAGINVVERVPLREGRNPYNNNYLNIKARKLGHMLDEIV
ncbi:GTP cyclohydrolase II [Endozoicomonas sp. SM1973]|uniref:GTP cyclohydrolase-2 n=2 Tax=Spartinivicinus marinus TaxID=2994442 RepID=A0A853HZB9_9GAMM|nr:GTP cyclohydrolase II [Spartinivicinus marinus]